MGEILAKLAQLFIQTIPTVVFVFALYFILGRFLFAPLSAVMKKREEATTGAMARAREQNELAEQKARQYESSFQAARQEVYRQRESDRRTILQDRDAALKHAKQQSETLLGEAQASLGKEVARNKQELEASCQSLGQEIAETILGGGATSGERGVRT